MAHNISKKQAGVIYRNWKQGNLTATKETMNLVYACAEYNVTTDSLFDELTYELRACIDAIFANDMAKAQECLDRFVTIRSRKLVAA